MNTRIITIDRLPAWDPKGILREVGPRTNKMVVQQKVAGANAADPRGSQLIQNSETARLVGGFSHLENISQWEGLSHILWKIKNVPNHQPDTRWWRTQKTRKVGEKVMSHFFGWFLLINRSMVGFTHQLRTGLLVMRLNQMINSTWNCLSTSSQDCMVGSSLALPLEKTGHLSLANWC